MIDRSDSDRLTVEMLNFHCRPVQISIQLDVSVGVCFQNQNSSASWITPGEKYNGSLTTWEQRHWRPGKFSGLLRFTQWNNEWHASRSEMSLAKISIFPHSLVRITKELCQFFEKLVRLGVTCAAAPAPLVTCPEDINTGKKKFMVTVTCPTRPPQPKCSMTSTQP